MKAAIWLNETSSGARHNVTFQRIYGQASSANRIALATSVESPRVNISEDSLKTWLANQSEGDLYRLETEALEREFGSELERSIIVDGRSRNVPVLSAGRIRQEYIRRYGHSRAAEELKTANAG